MRMIRDEDRQGLQKALAHLKLSEHVHKMLAIAEIEKVLAHMAELEKSA